MSAVGLADGPAYYLGGSIMSAVLPYAAFIVIATALYFLYRRQHSVGWLKYLAGKHQAAVRTPEADAVQASGHGHAAQAPEQGRAAQAPEHGREKPSDLK